MSRSVFFKGPKRFFIPKIRSKPAVLDDPELGVHGFVTIRKDEKPLKIHYVAKGEEDNPLMLFLHGFPEFWYSWRHQVKAFADKYRTVAIDMRGFGDSDKPPNISDYSIDKLSDDVMYVIKELGYESCVLVAHDWGGAVAWDFVHRHSSMVKAFIVCNSPHNRAFGKHLATCRKQMAMSWYIYFFQLPWVPEFIMMSDDFEVLENLFTNSAEGGAKAGSFTQEDIEAYKYTFTQPGGLTCPINYYRAMFRNRDPTPKEKLAPKVSAPTLVVWGTKDRALDKPMAEMSRKYCEDFTLKYVEGASHWVQQEEPEIVNKHMREFLGRATPSKL